MFDGAKFFSKAFFGGIGVILAMALGGAGVVATTSAGVAVAIALYYMLYFANRLEGRDIDDAWSRRPPPRPSQHHRRKDRDR